MTDLELERYAFMVPNESPLELAGIIGAARGEWGERRAVRLAKTLPCVIDVWRASQQEDRDQATDIFVKRQDGVVVPLQIKTRSSKPSSAKFRRARKFGARVARIPITASDDDASKVLQLAIFATQPSDFTAAGKEDEKSA
jgi:hypothetical protein